MSAKRVLLYVQHLLGIGHLKRAATLADAMTRAGLKVTFVSGGLVVPGMAINAARLVQLAPASAADLSFKAIVDVCGNPVDDAWKQARRDNLLAAWREADPQALVIELFPFGRRLMRFELLPLLEAAHAAPRRPVVVSSVRDVLGGGQKDPARQDQMLELFERYFDRLLVHGDPALIRFEQTFGHAARIAHKLHYTGYVVDRAPPAGALGPGGTDEVIVSVGGGAVGRLLLETAMRARPLCALARHTWRFLAGTQVTDTELVELGALARGADGGAAAVEVERNRADFRQLLANCRLSVSQGGYNTIMETLDAGAPSVVVPFAGGAEIEQSLRARLLAERGWIDMVEESDLNPRTLADAIDRAARRSAPKSGVVDLDGARNSAALLARWTSELAW